MGAVLVGFLLGASGVGLALLIGSLTWGGIITSRDCDMEFYVDPLSTPYGWFYTVRIGEPQPLVEYTVVLFVYSSPDPAQQEIVDYSGPLVDLVGATGNFSFEDRGIHPGKLDDGGDYFWAREWHNIRVERMGRIVGGTIACG